jgi:hypothetical protein
MNPEPEQIFPVFKGPSSGLHPYLFAYSCMCADDAYQSVLAGPMRATSRLPRYEALLGCAAPHQLKGLVNTHIACFSLPVRQ